MLALVVPAIALIAVVATRAIEGPSGSAAARAGANAVVIQKFAFHPPKLTVARGTTLEVANEDDTVHTLSAGTTASEPKDLGGGQTARVALEQSGSFSYFCKIHNFMTGTLVVK